MTTRMSIASRVASHAACAEYDRRRNLSQIERRAILRACKPPKPDLSVHACRRCYTATYSNDRWLRIYSMWRKIRLQVWREDWRLAASRKGVFTWMLRDDDDCMEPDEYELAHYDVQLCQDNAHYDETYITEI